ncbi:MAG TPA: DUF6252 family protein [Flavobacterium sp.]|nr:DUF6252 family protein [Flavobacterium sp.]
MKKILSLLVLVMALSSCEDDATFNNPSVQGTKDNTFWRATTSSAKITGGSMTITAVTPSEILTLTTSSADVGTYTLGTTTANKATYTVEADGVSSAYATGAGLGNGEIKIQAGPAGTVTGTFKFNAPAVSGMGGAVVNYINGVFYHVPIQ